MVANTAFDLFGEILSKAGGDKFTPEKYRTYLDELFDAASGDKEVDMIVTIRKGDQIGVFALRKGQMTNEPRDIRSILLPVVTRI